MKLKKWGSLLTALAMVGSMATYVPATVSAAEAEDTTVKISGTLEGSSAVKYEITHEKDAANPAVLTITPATAGAAYTVPDELLFWVASSCINTVASDKEDNFDTVTECFDNIKTINIKGAAQISDGAFTAERGVNVTVDGETSEEDVTGLKFDGMTVNIACNATYEEVSGTTSTFKALNINYESGDTISGIDFKADTAPVPTATHEMEANTAKKNHVCKHGDKIDASFRAHDFSEANATIDKVNGTHTCKCGKSSEDYKLSAEEIAKLTKDDLLANHGYQTAEIANYIHSWDATGTKHNCTVCKAEDVYAHTPKYTSKNARTHEKTCTGCNATISAAEEHKFAFINVFVNGASNTGYNFVMGQTPKDNMFCVEDGCTGAHTAAADHTYEYAWSAKTDDLGVAELKKVGTATGTVCACGAIKEHTHSYTRKNGLHLCSCGFCEGGSPTASHDYSMKYNAKGVLISATDGLGVICSSCGAVDPDHYANKAHVSGAEKKPADTFFNTSTHKHFCYCGNENESATHTLSTDYAKYGSKHVCEHCLYEDKGAHVHQYVLVTYTTDPRDATYEEEPTDKNAKDVAITTDGTYYKDKPVCACGDVLSTHTHNYAFGIKGSHYCACGAKKPASDDYHDYEYVNSEGEVDKSLTASTAYAQQCQTCGDIKGHTHTFDYTNGCKCTNDLCTVTDHDYKVMTGSKHICQNCGKISTDHNYNIVDTVNKKHKCACGAEASGTPVCTFVAHECECGQTEHETDNTSVKIVDGIKVHICNGTYEDEDGATVQCGHVYTKAENYGHDYAYEGNDKCTTCGQLNHNHVHKPATVGAGTTDTCRCEAEIEHVWGVAASDWKTYHQCANHAYTVTETNGKITFTEGEQCTNKEAHTFVDEDKNVLNFCECGAMNPKVLADAGVLKNTGTKANPEYAKALNFDNSAAADYLPSMYRADFLVTLKKAYVNALAYDIATSTVAADVKLAASETAQATALEAVEAFKTVWATEADNQAASSIRIKFVKEYDEDENVIDSANFGKAVYADNSDNEIEAVYGKVGEVVTIKVMPNAGYKFAGWYTKETPSATDTPVSTSAAYEVAVKDGHTTYYAKFVENASVQIAFDEGLMYKVKGTSDAFAESNQYYLTKKFLINQEVIVMPEETYFTESGTKDITGIKDKFGNVVEYNIAMKADGTENTAANAPKNAYVFTVSAANEFSVATYAKADGTNTYVQFRVGNRIVASDVFETRDVSSIKPVDPQKLGHVFKGWYFQGNDSDEIELLKSVSKNSGVLLPAFEIIDDLTVEIKNGTIDKASVKDAYTYGDQILVTADLKNAAGKYFSGWYDANGNLLSLKRTDYIIVKDNMVITAKYDRTEELVLEAGIDLTSTRTSSAVVLSSTRSLTDDMKFVEVGMLYAGGKVAEADLNIDNTALRRKVKTASETGKNGTHDVTIALSNPNTVVSAIAYFIYTDAEGNNHIEYSEPLYSNPVE